MQIILFFQKSATIKSSFIFLRDVYFFLVLSRAPCSGRRGRMGSSLMRASGGFEIGEQFVHMCGCPCQSTCMYVCEGVELEVGGVDARIKKRLVEIKALP